MPLEHPDFLTRGHFPEAHLSLDAGSGLVRARELAATTGAELHAIYVIGDYFEQISVMFPEGGRSALSRMRGEVTDRMQSFARESDGRLRTHIAEGRPYAEIVRLAAEIDADLIVIGTSVHASPLFAGQRDALDKFLNEPPDRTTDSSAGRVTLQHLEGAAWNFVSIQRWNSWADYGKDNVASIAQMGRNQQGGWFKLRDLVSFHTDTLCDRIAP